CSNNCIADSLETDFGDISIKVSLERYTCSCVPNSLISTGKMLSTASPDPISIILWALTFLFSQSDKVVAVLLKTGTVLVYFISFCTLSLSVSTYHSSL